MLLAEVKIAFLNKNDRINPRRADLPEYPPDAVADGIDDVVIVEFTVGADGKATDTRIVRSVPGRCSWRPRSRSADVAVQFSLRSAFASASRARRTDARSFGVVSSV